MCEKIMKNITSPNEVSIFWSGKYYSFFVEEWKSGTNDCYGIHSIRLKLGWPYSYLHDRVKYTIEAML